MRQDLLDEPGFLPQGRLTVLAAFEVELACEPDVTCSKSSPQV